MHQTCQEEQCEKALWQKDPFQQYNYLICQIKASYLIKKIMELCFLYDVMLLIVYIGMYWLIYTALYQHYEINVIYTAAKTCSRTLLWQISPFNSISVRSMQYKHEAVLSEWCVVVIKHA